jgi:hypothetical protein
LIAGCFAMGVDPDGLPGEIAYEVAFMGEAMKRIPPRFIWVQEYAEEQVDESWEAVARL